MSATATTSDQTIRPRAIAAVAANQALLALPREQRAGVRPVAALLPEIAEAEARLAAARPDLDFWVTRMADGTGFADVRRRGDGAVFLSSERFADHEDQVERLVARATVAQSILAGAFGEL